jgi:hypothetical protein
MTLSRQSVEILLDLIEIKVSALQIQDRDDARELNKLRKCRQELLSEQNKIGVQRKDRLINPASFSEKSFRKTSYPRY